MLLMGKSTNFLWLFSIADCYQRVHHSTGFTAIHSMACQGETNLVAQSYIFGRVISLSYLQKLPIKTY